MQAAPVAAREAGVSAWDDLARLAASIARCPIAFVAVEDGGGPSLRAHVGLDADAQGPADRLYSRALGAVACDESGVAAAGPSGEAIWLVFCAPLADAQGRTRGALCVGDERPRRLDGDTCDALAALARIAAALAGLGPCGAPVSAAPAPASRPVGTSPAASGAGGSRQGASVAVAIIELDRRGLSPEACEAMVARIEHAVDAVVGAGDVVSRHDARELLLVLAEPTRAAATLQRVRAAISALPGAPQVAIGMATDANGPVPLEDLFLEAEADLHRPCNRGPIVFVPAQGGGA